MKKYLEIRSKEKGIIKKQDVSAMADNAITNEANKTALQVDEKQYIHLCNHAEGKPCRLIPVGKKAREVRLGL